MDSKLFSIKSTCFLSYNRAFKSAIHCNLGKRSLHILPQLDA